MRTWFKKQKDTKFMKKAEKLGADYVEDGAAIFIIPKQYGDFLMAIKLKKNGRINFGKINKSCMNFEEVDNPYYYKGEQKWIIEILTKILADKK